MQNITRYERHCEVKSLNLLTTIYYNLDKKYQRHVHKFKETIEINDFILNLKKVIKYYDSTIANKNVEKETYQREIRNIERKLLKIQN